MKTLDQIKTILENAVPGASIESVPAGTPTQDASLLLNREHALELARCLRGEPELQFDYASNVSGVDWPERIIKEKIKTRKTVDGVEKEVEEIVEKRTPAYLEAVYHLYSISLKHGPLVIRMRTEDRSERVRLPSLVPVWRSCEFQEREVFDLYGIVFEDHPDLRRILMWDGFADYPMRKDYVAPDDYEYEPTPHEEVLERARAHYPKEEIA